MARANKINATAMSANRAKVCIYLLSPLALDLPFDAARICDPNQTGPWRLR
jgi:hypothetical protein